MKKWIATLLACLMALLPIFSLADSDSPLEELFDQLDDGKQELLVTMKATPGEALNNAFIKSLMESATVQMNLREDMAGFSLLFDGNETVTAQMRVADGALYALCNAIGSDIYRLEASQIGAFTAPLSAMAVAEELDLDELKDTSFHELFTDMVDGDKEMMAWYDGVLAKAVTEKGEFATEHSDPAVTKVTVPLTAETLKNVLNTKFVKDKLDEIDNKKAQELLDKLRDYLDKCDMTATVTCLMAEKDVPVSLTMEMRRRQSGGDNVKTYLIEQAQLDKKTIAGATLLTGSASRVVEGESEPALTAAGTVMFSAKGDAVDFDLSGQTNKLAATAKGTLTAGASGITGTVDATFTSGGKTRALTADCMLDISKTGFNGAATLSIDGTSVGKINIESVLTAPSNVFDKLLTATPENSINLTNMSVDERDKLMSTITSNAMLFAISMMGKLPANVSSELVGMLLGK